MWVPLANGKVPSVGECQDQEQFVNHVWPARPIDALNLAPIHDAYSPAVCDLQPTLFVDCHPLAAPHTAIVSHDGKGRRYIAPAAIPSRSRSSDTPPICSRL